MPSARRRQALQELDTFAPRVRSSGELAPFLRRFAWVAAALVVLLVLGTAGYVAFEGVSVWNGFLWSLDTVATEGARNRPDTTGGEIVWVLLIVLGVGTLLYALVTAVEVLVSGHLRTLLGDRRTQKAIDALQDHVIICGFGRVGRQAAADLRAAGSRYVVIDPRRENFEEARGVGVRLIEGSASQDDVLVQAGVDRARALIACVDNDAENVFIVLSARQLNPELSIIARASTRETEPKLLLAGANRVISPYRTSGSEMARVAITPQVSGALDVAPEYRLEEIEVESGSGADGATIVDVRGDAIIVAVRRPNGTFQTQPPGDTALNAGDVILAMGPLQTMKRLEGALAPDHGAEGRTPPAAPGLERPRQAEHGDYATNAALMLAKTVGAPPRDVAARLAMELNERLGASLASSDIAGPGFLNLVLTDAWYLDALAAIAAAGEGWGGGGADPVRNVNVEFVSANPTGPVHVGGTRNAAYGDALARLLAFRGHRVHREFYVNDAGSQIDLLGASIKARARGEEPPEGGYVGDYITELAGEIEGAADLPTEELAHLGVDLMLAQAERSLARFRVTFDTWFREHTLHAGSPSPVQRAFAVLESQGRTFRKDGALWARTTEFGDDKDRVLERSNGEHTYFASDCAYHQDKRERGFDLMIDVWGADHHGYVERTHAAYRALGGGEGELELVIMQLVHLVEGGERARMSKRAGEFVTLDDLVEDIGVDAARWFLLARSHETTMELDLALAREQSNDNPVYYVQYAHARIASILVRASEAGEAPAIDPAYVLHPSERALVQRLLDFPDEVAEAGDKRAPHRIAAYALDTAQAFSAFYRDCQVVGAEPAAAGFRVQLCGASKQTLARALDLLGVSAPSEM